MSQIDELRHLAGIKIVFGYSNVEFIAIVPSLAPRQEIEKIQFIQSDSEKVYLDTNSSYLTRHGTE